MSSRLAKTCIVVALLSAAALLSYPNLDGPFSNGDEVVYAEMAREMASTGDWTTLRWQGQPILNRPPLSVWVLAAASAVAGPSELALRGVVVLEGAAAVALLFLFGARRYSVAVGLCAALLLATAGLWYFYAGYIESEPLLIALVIGSFLCWERSRTDPRWRLGWGVCLGLALLTKQIVGAFPLIALAQDRLEHRSPDWKHVPAALGLAVVVAAPWHVWQAIRFGGEFWDPFLIRYVGLRAIRPMHHVTSPAFYLETLWKHEGLSLILAIGGLIYAVHRRDLMLPVWVVAVLLPFTLAASRYDHYTLLAYPALALATARLVTESLPRLRTALATAAVAASVIAHVVPRLGEPIGGDAEMRDLASAAAAHSSPGDELFLVDEFPYSARFYSGLHVTTILTNRAIWQDAAQALPGDPVFAQFPARVVRRLERWFLIAPLRHLALLKDLGNEARVLRRGQVYFLASNVPAIPSGD